MSAPNLTISSIENPQLKHLRLLLKQSKARKEHMEAVLEGKHLLDAFLRSKRVPEKIYLSHEMLQDPDLQNLVSKLGDRLVFISHALAQRLSSLQQAYEVLSLIRIHEDFSTNKSQNCVILEGIQDPGNLGTILRSAAATGISRIVYDTSCADPWSPKVLRAAMGAHFLVNLIQVQSVAEFLQSVQTPIMATTLSHPAIKSLYELDLHPDLAWVFGNEGSGLSKEVCEMVSFGVKIPMIGETESLNVAMAATVCLFEQMRQRQS